MSQSKEFTYTVDLYKHEIMEIINLIGYNIELRDYLIDALEDENNV